MFVFMASSPKYRMAFNVSYFVLFCFSPPVSFCVDSIIKSLKIVSGSRLNCFLFKVQCTWCTSVRQGCCI